MDHHVTSQLSSEAVTQLRDGINLLLSRWHALQTAVENEWGGRDSRQRAQQLAIDIFSFLTQSRGPLYIDDLENMLDEFMLSLNTEIGDGSLEEISEKIMVMHEECLEGNFVSIERLRETNPPRVSHIEQSDDDDDDDDDDASSEDDDNDSSEMAVDAPQCGSNLNARDMMVDEAPRMATAEAEDGWTLVSSRRNRGRTGN